MQIPAKAKRCPHCRKDQRSFFGRHPIFSTLGIGLVSLWLLSALSAAALYSASPNHHSSASPASLTVVPTVTPLPEDIKQTLASTYCQKHQQTMNLPDFTKDGYPPIQNDDAYSRTYEHGGSLAASDCYGVIDALEKKSGDSYENIQRIASGTIWMGMLPFEAELAVGLPTKINTTTTALGENDQWVYGTGLNNSYLYFTGTDKDHLKLSSWQNS